MEGDPTHHPTVTAPCLLIATKLCKQVVPGEISIRRPAMLRNFFSANDPCVVFRSNSVRLSRNQRGKAGVIVFRTRFSISIQENGAAVREEVFLEEIFPSKFRRISWMDAFVEERRNFERRSRRFLVSHRSHYRSSFESEALDSDISHVFSSFFIL